MESLPILHCHGISDPLVRFHYAQHGQQYLQSQGFSSYSLKGFNNLQHSVNNDVLRDVLVFLSTGLPHGPEHLPAPKPFADMSVRELKGAVRDAGLARRAVGFSEKREFVDLLTEHYKGPHVQ